jgi:acyl-CoA synthetase (AMP-forming)/AMP-acid ligase II
VRYTFAELDERANRSAHVLSALGLSKGDRIAVLLPNGHHFVEIFYAAARAGLIVVPLNWRLVADELAFLLRDSGATVVVFHSDHDAVVLDLLGRGKADDSGIDVSHWLRVGSNNPTWALDLEARVDRAPAGPLVVPTDASDPVFIMYTSGTTGLPKGVIHTHDSLQWAVLTSLASVDVRYRDRYLISLPLFHVGALSPMACCIYRGSTIILLNQFDPRFIWDVFRDENVTTTLAVPVERNARDLSARAPPTVGAALDHEWGGPSATLVDRGLCRSGIGGSPGIRPDRVRRPGVRDQSRCRDVSYWFHRQGVLPYRRANR